MSHAAFHCAALLSVPLIFALPVGTAQSRQGFIPFMRCLPPGSPGPVQCDSASAGSAILLRTNPQGSAEPVMLIFKELTSRRNARVVRTTVAGEARAGDGTHRVSLPRSLCTNRGQAVRYQVWQAMPAVNVIRSIGIISVDC